MKQEVKKYKARIGNDVYILVSDEEEATIFQAVQTVDSMIKELAAKAGDIEEKKVAVLAALQIATKLYQVEKTLEYEQRLSNIITSVLDDQHDQQEKIVL